MKILDSRLLRGGSKRAKYLLSSPQKSQRVLYHSEAGSLSQETLPIFTGFMTTETENVKKAWKAEHILRLKVLKNGEPAQDETVLVISDRSYMPLDPLGILKKSEKESRKSLDSIGGNIHDQELMAVGDKMDEGNDMRHTLIMGFLLLDAMCIIAKVIFK